MRLLIVRHAIAQPHGTPDVADEDRRLTPRGKRRFQRAADGLARILPRPDVLLTSPLPRALETAEIAAKAWGRIKPRPEPLLAAGDNHALLASLSAHDKDAMVAVVGHEPHVSALLGSLVRGDAGRVPFKKGGAALVDLDGDGPGGGRSRLIWFLPPRLLRKLGRD